MSNNNDERLNALNGALNSVTKKSMVFGRIKLLIDSVSNASASQKECQQLAKHLESDINNEIEELEEIKLAIVSQLASSLGLKPEGMEELKNVVEMMGRLATDTLSDTDIESVLMMTSDKNEETDTQLH